MFTRLGHRAVSSGNHEDGAVHLGSTSNHVLNVVSVTRAVNVSIVARSRFILNVSRVNGNTTSLFFRSSVDLVVSLSFATELARQNRRDSGCQRGLTMVHVTNCAHVNVGLCTFKLTLGHFWSF